MSAGDSEEEHLVSLTFRKVVESEEKSGEEVEHKNKESLDQSFLNSTEEESDLSTPTACGPPLENLPINEDETPTNLNPTQKVQMIDSKDGDLSRPNFLPKSSENLQNVPLAPKSTTSFKLTPVPPPRTLKRKVTDLKCSEIRWFYQEPKSTLWTPLNGRDSLMIETKYRKQNKIELDETMKKIHDEYLSNYNLEISEAENEVESFSNSVDRPMVVVLNGQYRVNKENTRIDPIYWKDDSKEIRRGSWFTPEFQPLEMPLSDQIERNHLQYFKGQTIPEGITVFSKSETSNKPVLAELHTEAYDIKWNSVIDITLHQRGNTILRYLWGKSTPLRRGYDKTADWNDAAAEISHLVLVVHGIGQKGYENLIAQNANQIRDGVVAAMKSSYPDEKTRPIFLPVEWRSSLVLDNGLTENITIPKMISMRSSLNSTAMDVMYYQSPLFRTEIVRGVVAQLNRTYKLFKSNNPNFCGSVSIFGHSLGSVIVYDILTQYSPLMLYDKYVTKSIDEYLENTENQKAREAMESLKSAREKVRDTMEGGIQNFLLSKEEQLAFKVKYMFAVGSPLGVFLTMRGGSSHDLLPSSTNVERIFNIFHPYDPVAYRLEPFFTPEYKNIRPVKLFSNTDLRGRASYDNLPLDVYKHYLKKMKNQSKKKKDEKPTDARSGADEDIDEEDECDSEEDAQSGCSSPRSMTPPLNSRETVKEQKPCKKGWFSFGSSNNNPKKTTSSASLNSESKAVGTVQIQSINERVEIGREAEADLPLAERILGSGKRVPHRIDFQLQPGLTDKSYWSVFKSHFAYWTNGDLCLFLANILYSKPAKLEEAKSSWA